MTSSGPAPTPRPGRTAGRTARAIWRRLGLLGAESATPPRPLTFRAAVVIFVLAIVLAYLFVGPWFTIVTAALAIVTVRFNPDPGRPFAFATLALIVGAAFVSSVLVAPTEEQIRRSCMPRPDGTRPSSAASPACSSPSPR
ncbi:MAG: hypothetical protein R2699_06565 [Acidimicrobiales bacterium]